VSFLVLEKPKRALLTACEQDPARKLSAKLYDIYHCCVYCEKLLMMNTGTASSWFYYKNLVSRVVKFKMKMFESSITHPDGENYVKIAD